MDLDRTDHIAKIARAEIEVRTANESGNYRDFVAFCLLRVAKQLIKLSQICGGDRPEPS